jgi:hypothetical protein
MNPCLDTGAVETAMHPTVGCFPREALGFAEISDNSLEYGYRYGTGLYPHLTDSLQTIRSQNQYEVFFRGSTEGKTNSSLIIERDNRRKSFLLKTPLCGNSEDFQIKPTKDGLSLGYQGDTVYLGYEANTKVIWFIHEALDFEFELINSFKDFALNNQAVIENRNDLTVSLGQDHEENIPFESRLRKFKRTTKSALGIQFSDTGLWLVEPVNSGQFPWEFSESPNGDITIIFWMDRVGISNHGNGTVVYRNRQEIAVSLIKKTLVSPPSVGVSASNTASPVTLVTARQ